MPEPFTITVPGERLDAIRAELERFDWSSFPDAGNWASGVGVADFRRLVGRRLERYDWRAAERRLNALLCEMPDSKVIDFVLRFMPEDRRAADPALGEAALERADGSEAAA